MIKTTTEVFRRHFFNFEILTRQMDESRDWEKNFHHIGHWFKPNPTQPESNYHPLIFMKRTGGLNSISNKENKQLQLLGA